MELLPTASPASAAYRRALLVARVLLVFAILYKVADAIIPKGHTDPLYYTLYAPKLFHVYGWKILTHDLIAFLMTGYLEGFTLLYFQFTENLGWIHILAQLTTLGFSLLLGAYLMRRWIKDPFIGALAAFSVLTFNCGAQTFIFPKGDGPAGVFAMIAAYAIYSGWSPWAIGALLGLLPSLKMSGIYPAFVLGILTVVKYRKQPKVFLTAGLAALAVFAPILIRNYVVIGNPLYPGLLQKIPGKASRAILDFCAIYFNSPPNWQFVRSAIADLVRGKIIFGLWAFFLYRKLRTKEWSGLFYVVAGLGTFVVYCATNGFYQDVRFFFSVFFILGLFAFLELDRVFVSPQPHFLKSAPGLFLLFGLALCDARLELAPKMIVRNVREILTLPMPEIIDREMAREKPIRDLFPDSPDRERRIISETTGEGYYLKPNYRIEHMSHSLEAGFLPYCTDADLLQLERYDFYILSPVGNTPCHQKIRREGKLLGTFDYIGLGSVYARTWGSNH